MLFKLPSSFKKKVLLLFLSFVIVAGLYLTKGVFPVMVSPVENFLSNLVAFPKDFLLCLYGENKLINENRRLELEVQKLKLEIDNLSYIKKENDILRKYLGFKTDYGIKKAIVGRVVGFSADNWVKSFKIDVGVEDGVKKGDLVVYDGVVVGVVDAVFPASSIVLTVGDRNFRITVRTKKTGEVCLYQGFDEKTGYLKYVRPDQDIRVGDTVMTDAISENVPSGIPVGVVKNISQKEGEFFRSVEVSLLYRGAVLDYVMVVSR